MAENPDPKNLEYVTAGALAALGAVIAFWNRILGKSTPCDESNTAFRKQVLDDVAEMKGTLHHAVEKASEAHEKIYDRLRALETNCAVLDARLTSCQNGLEVIKRSKE